MELNSWKCCRFENRVPTQKIPGDCETYFLEGYVEHTYRKKPPLQGQLRLSCGSDDEPNGQFNQLAWANVKRWDVFNAGRY